MTEGTLVLSSNRGRYAFKDAEEGPYGDLTSGDRCEILLGGHWIVGYIDHASIYSIADLPHARVEGLFLRC